MTVPTSQEQLDVVLDAAAAAARPLGELRPAQQAAFLRGVADALDTAAEELVPIARRETHLPEPRLRGELSRTTFQLRLFAEVLGEGAYLEATIDHADPEWPPAARPDLRRMLLPLGPVVVFAASNFPFAFSVAGGDTASALAAGCPVVLKAHPGHPQLSRRTGEIVASALAHAGAPQGTFAVVEGEEAGRAAVLDPRIKAAAFTGSTHGGRALFDLANSRPDPIPFYGELGSLNPVFVTDAAATRRGQRIWSDYVDSFTLGAGQFCTKPGLLFVPAGSGAEEALTELVAGREPATMLNERIARGHREVRERLASHPVVRTLGTGRAGDLGPAATVLSTSVPDLLAHQQTLLTECFGPTSIVVTYTSDTELLAAARAFPGQLTATVHGEHDDPIVPPLLAELRERAGRVIWNDWPTGVAVTHAMHHGGPYPATTAPLHTSVGTTAIRRFLRPVSYQDLPQHLLPLALRDDNPLGLPRRVNGVMDNVATPARARR